MNGSTKFAVPTCTAVAPAMMNSSASSAVAMPPMPMMGSFTASSALPDHAHGDRPDRRAAQPAHHVRELGPPRLDVDRHREERVDERDGVGAGFLGGARERGDVGDVRRQLRE